MSHWLHIAWLAQLAGCRVYEDLSASCWFGNIHVPW